MSDPINEASIASLNSSIVSLNSDAAVAGLDSDNLVFQSYDASTLIPSHINNAPFIVEQKCSCSSLKVVEESETPDDESLLSEVRRLEATIASLSEVNERIMAQNIALLADLEAAQKCIREVRSERDAMAQQLYKQNL